MSRITIAAVLLCAFGGTAVFHAAFRPEAPVDRRADAIPQRVVSLAPSVTETLFALRLGDRVVGVTRYCLYPPEAQQKTIVGGFIDPNYEAIVALRPDVVCLLEIHTEARLRLNSLDVPTISVDHRTIDGILMSFETLADRFGVPDAGDALVSSCRARINAVQEAIANLSRPRVLLSSARDLGTGRIESVYVAGRGQWYDELIACAGGENAYPDDGIAFPEVAPEGLMRLDPDVIVELVPKSENAAYTHEDLLAEWRTVPGLRAVREGRVHLMRGDYVSVPGPRFVDTLEDLARVLHPEVDWGTP
jgi:iron complex transport system substrate-binding protein